MNIKECYACIGANWQEVYERFGCNDAIVKKFAIKFLEDPSFHDMKEAVAEGDTDRAFRAAHTLKGICANLGFKSLFEVSYEITEALRAGDMEQAKVMWPDVQACYARVENALNQLEQ